MRRLFNFGTFGHEILFEKRGPTAPDPTPAEIGRQLRPYVGFFKDVDAAVYALAKGFAPPKVDLRQGEVEGSYGNEAYAKRSVQHVNPEDPTREDLEYYCDSYPFLEPTDMIYYFYAWFRELSNDENIGGMPDNFFYSLGWRLPDLIQLLDEAQLLALYCGLVALWEGMEFPLTSIDWTGSENLLKFLGIEGDFYSHSPTAWCNL